MHRIGKLVLVIGLTLLAGSAALFAADSPNDFTIVNKTGFGIEKVFVSTSDTNDWENDILGEGVLGLDEEKNVTFAANTSTKTYDLKVVYVVTSGPEQSAIWEDLDLTKINKITLKYDKATDKTSAVTE